jgi:3-oxoadipate enol-lactonase/4-carboxymuconolactone decarboxylase
MTTRAGVRVEGPEGAPYLVLLNSLGTSAEMWEPLVGPLAEQFRVVRIDARGHGDGPVSPPGTELGIADLARDVLDVLDALGVSRAHVAGVSVGGMTALWLAVHHPERVGRLALVCTSALLGPATGWLDRAATVRGGGMVTVADPVISRWLTPALAARDRALVDRLHATFTRIDVESYAQCCEAIAAMDQTDDLRRVAAPTLVVTASGDTAIPPVHGFALHAGIPGSRLEVLAGAAHVPTFDQPALLASLLLQHFEATATTEIGMRTRRSVLGDEHVDGATASTTEFTAAFQDFLTRYAWGEVWSRPGLSRRDRSLVTLSALVTLGAEHEIAMHVRAAIRNGLTRSEIGEALQHVALYAGLPRANRAFAIAQQVLNELPADAPIQEH